MAKSADAFRTISEVAEWLGVQSHVLRFWESKFTQIKPVKRAGGRRYYRPADMLLLGGIHKLLREDGMTIKGVQKLLREQGMAYVSDLSPPLDDQTDAALDTMIAEVAPAAPAVEEPAKVVPLVPKEEQAPKPAPEAAAEPPAPSPSEDVIEAAPEDDAEPELDFTSPPPAEKAPEPESVDDTPLAPPRTDNVVPAFMRTQAPKPAATPPQEAAPPPVVEESAPPAPPKPRIIDVPDEVNTDEPLTPSLMARVKTHRALSASEAAELRPLLSQLTALRDRMAAYRGQHKEE